jgi:tetratricopeptide (TPR) repeat protein
MPKARHMGHAPTEPFEELMAKAQDALRVGDLPAAERLFGQATVVKPASGPAWFGKGRAFALQDEWEKALRCFSIATKFDPTFGNAWAGLADSHLHLGEKEKALAALRKAEELRANDPRMAEIKAALG